MKILVLGSYYSNNLGDGVICECVAQRLRHHFPDGQIQIMDLRAREQFLPAAEPSFEQLRKRENRKNLRHLACRLGWDKIYAHELFRMEKEKAHFKKLGEQDCDVVVFAGGQMFMDSYALRLESVINSCKGRGVPVLFNACGVGPSQSAEIRRRLAKALAAPCVQTISTRDDAALIDSVYLSGDRHADVTYDPALWSGEVYHVEKKNSNVIGLGVMYPSNVNFGATCRFWKMLIRELEKRKQPWKIFVNGSGADVAFARYVHSLIPGLGRPFEDCIVPVPQTPQALVETIAGFESIISFRLHSHIIAASLDIPSVALVWDDKLRFFFHKIGHPERCCTPMDSPEKILALLDDARLQGYDRKLLEKQKQFADTLLYKSICEAVK